MAGTVEGNVQCCVWALIENVMQCFGYAAQETHPGTPCPANQCCTHCRNQMEPDAKITRVTRCTDVRMPSLTLLLSVWTAVVMPTYAVLTLGPQEAGCQCPRMLLLVVVERIRQGLCHNPASRPPKNPARSTNLLWLVDRVVPSPQCSCIVWFCDQELGSTVKRTFCGRRISAK